MGDLEKVERFDSDKSKPVPNPAHSPKHTVATEFGYWCADSLGLGIPGRVVCVPASEFNKEREMFDPVVNDTNAYERRQDELEADGQTRDELRAEHVKEHLDTWKEDGTYLCQQLYKQDGAENEAADLINALEALARGPTFSPEWLRAACAFTDGLPKYAEQLAKEAYPE